MDLKITKGKVRRPLRVVLYGPEGVGKSTLASEFPAPIFVDLEDGTDQLEVNRVRGIDSWRSLFEVIAELVTMDREACSTIVIDTADRAEYLCQQFVCRKYNKNSIEDFGYGKGYTFLAEEFQELLRALDIAIDAGKHVVVCAHAKMRKFEQPDELGAYDRWELKLSKQSAPALKEWCDMLLFLTYKTYVTTDSTGAKKAQGGERVIRCNHHPCWDAKNRQNLPDEMPLNWASLHDVFDYTPAAADYVKPVEQKRDPDQVTPATLERVYNMLIKDGMSVDELEKVVSDRGKYPAGTEAKNYSEKFVQGWIFKYWDSIKTIVAENRNKEES